MSETDLVSSPGKMDLSALGPKDKRLSGLLKPREALRPAPDVAETAPEPAAVPVSAVAVATTVESAVDAAVDVPLKDDEPASDRVGDAEKPAVVEPAPTAKVEPAEEEHSGHVTLYLPKNLNQWLAKHHDSTGISYPGIVLNAITWAHVENQMVRIFAPEDSPIPANDLFARATAIIKPVRGHADPETRPLRFRKDHMQVIISMARTWTADNRNAFFVGVLSAYRDDQTKPQETV